MCRTNSSTWVIIFVCMEHTGKNPNLYYKGGDNKKKIGK